MSKILNFDTRKGSLMDPIGNITFTNTATSIVDSEKGMSAKFDGSTSKLLYTSAEYLGAYTSGSIEVWFKTDITGASQAIFATADTAGVTTSLMLGTYTDNTLRMLEQKAGNKWVTSTNTVKFGQWNHAIVTSNGTAWAIYLNGVKETLQVTSANTGDWFGDVTGRDNISIGEMERSSATTFFNGLINKVTIYSETLTDAQCATKYADFLKAPSNIKKPKSILKMKPNDLKENGLVAAYNFIPQQGKLNDISGNGYNGTITTGVSDLNGIRFNGTDGLVTVSPTNSTLTGDFTIACTLTCDGVGAVQGIVGVASTNNYLIINASGSVVIRVGAGNAPAWTNAFVNSYGKKQTLVVTRSGNTAAAYLNGVDLGAASLSYTASTTFSISRLAIGYAATNFNGVLQDMRIYNIAKDATFATKYHNSQIRTTLLEDFSNNGADGAACLPEGWQVNTGTYKIGQYNFQGGKIIDSTVANLSVSNGWAVASNQYTYTTNGSTSYISKLNLLTIGKQYKFTYTVVANPNLTVLRIDTLNFLGTSATISATPGTYSYTGPAVTDDFYLRVSSGSVSGLVLENIYVEEVLPLPNFNGNKYLEMGTVGTIGIPSKTAYGTWEFDLYKADDTGAVDCGFCNTNNIDRVSTNPVGGYYAGFSTAEVVFLQKRVSTTTTSLMLSAASYITSKTWYRIRIIRTVAGVFTVYIKGGAFGTSAWTQVVAGTGTNPVTDTAITASNFLTFTGIVTGDRLANIKVYDGIIL